MEMGSVLVGYDDRADLEISDVDQHIVAVNQPPLISARRRVQMVLAIVDAFAAIPVFMLDRSTFLPLLVLHIVMVVFVFVVVVVVLRIS